MAWERTDIIINNINFYSNDITLLVNLWTRDLCRN